MGNTAEMIIIPTNYVINSCGYDVTGATGSASTPSWITDLISVTVDDAMNTPTNNIQDLFDKYTALDSKYSTKVTTISNDVVDLTTKVETNKSELDGKIAGIVVTQATLATEDFATTVAKREAASILENGPTGSATWFDTEIKTYADKVTTLGTNVSTLESIMTDSENGVTAVANMTNALYTHVGIDPETGNLSAESGQLQVLHSRVGEAETRLTNMANTFAGYYQDWKPIDFTVTEEHPEVTPKPTTGMVYEVPSNITEVDSNTTLVPGAIYVYYGGVTDDVSNGVDGTRNKFYFIEEVDNGDDTTTTVEHLVEPPIGWRQQDKASFELAKENKVQIGTAASFTTTEDGRITGWQYVDTVEDGTTSSSDFVIKADSFKIFGSDSSDAIPIFKADPTSDEVTIDGTLIVDTLKGKSIALNSSYSLPSEITVSPNSSIWGSLPTCFSFINDVVTTEDGTIVYARPIGLYSETKIAGDGSAMYGLSSSTDGTGAAVVGENLSIDKSSWGGYFRSEGAIGLLGTTSYNGTTDWDIAGVHGYATGDCPAVLGLNANTNDVGVGVLGRGYMGIVAGCTKDIADAAATGDEAMLFKGMSTDGVGIATKFTVDYQGNVHVFGDLIVDGDTAISGDTGTTETLTSLSLDTTTNLLTYQDEDGTNTDIDLSYLLDDTNLARTVSGSLGSNSTLTLTRDDNTTIDIDLSALEDAYEGTVKSVSAGNGMNFTTITDTGEVVLGTPTSISLTSSNSVSANSHSHALSIPTATASEDGLLSSTDKSKLDGVENNANNYSHPTGSGYTHIPSGGSAGQYLKNSGNGSAAWAYAVPVNSVNDLNFGPTDSDVGYGLEEAQADKFIIGFSNTDTGGSNSSCMYLANAKSTGYALYTKGRTYLDGDVTVTGTFSSSNLSGTNTGDETKASIDALGVDAATINGYTVDASVPDNAVFTDTTYTVATTRIDGLMSSEDKSKLDDIAAPTKEDIDALGVDAATVGGYTLGTNIPAAGGVATYLKVTGSDTTAWAYALPISSVNDNNFGSTNSDVNYGLSENAANRFITGVENTDTSANSSTLYVSTASSTGYALYAKGKVVVDGNIEGSNISGTNTGDQSSSDFRLNDLAEKSYNSLTDTPSIPSSTSDLTNNSWFITTSSVTYEVLNDNGDVGNGSAQIAAGNHDHNGTYEPVFSKNSGFNKAFGTSSGTVAEGNHTHDGVYEPTFNKASAFNKNFGTSAGTVAEGNHWHSTIFTYALLYNDTAVQKFTIDPAATYANGYKAVDGGYGIKISLGAGPEYYQVRFTISGLGDATDGVVECQEVVQSGFDDSADKYYVTVIKCIDGSNAGGDKGDAVITAQYREIDLANGTVSALADLDAIYMVYQINPYITT